MAPGAYRQLPAAEGEVDAGHLASVPFGAEGSNTWQTLSNRQRLLVYFQFGLLGAGVLLPFNALITPSEYFRAAFASTKYANTFASWIIVVYNASTIAFSAHATSTLEATTPKRRMFKSGLCIMGALSAFTLSTLIVGRAHSGPSELYFAFVMLASVLMAAATAYFQNATVGLSASFGARCMGSMLAFQGVVGAVISLAQLIAALSFVKAHHVQAASAQPIDAETAKAATTFFAFSTVMMGFILISFRMLTGTELYREISDKESAAMDEAALASSRPINSIDRLIAVQRKIGSLCYCIATVFVITLGLFPALTSRVTSSSAPPGSLLASPLVFSALHFLVFNTTDLVGRSVPSFVSRTYIPERGWLCVVLATLRVIFAPLFKLCHLQSSPTPSQGASSSAGLLHRTLQETPSILQSDWAFFLLLACFGLSNGYLSTSLFIVAPDRPTLRPDERQLAATVLSFWLTIGLAVGSALSFGTSNW